MISAIAIDDEPIALEIVKTLAEKVPFIQLESTFVNAFDALDYLNKNEVDLIFLDIKMPDISGIEFYNSLIRKPLLVFTTAYAEHAITGFELEALDYLLKPFTLTRFLKACNKAQEIILSKVAVANHIFIKDGYDMVKMVWDDILYVEATGNYMKYVTHEREVLTRATMRETLEQLPKQQFAQVQRSFIVNISHVDKIERHQLTLGSHMIPIGASFQDNVKKSIG